MKTGEKRRAAKDQWTEHPIGKEERKMVWGGAVWISSEWGKEKAWAVREAVGSPQAGCCCWKLDKREQISAAGSSNLSAAVPSCVTSQPSLGTSASLGALTPRGPPGKESATDKSLKVKGRFLYPAPATRLPASTCASVCNAGSDPLATTSENQAGWNPTSTKSLSATLGPGDFFKQMTTYAALLDPVERKQREGLKPLFI